MLNFAGWLRNLNGICRRIILDIADGAKKRLTVEDLTEAFFMAGGEEFANDRALLS